MDFPKRVYTEEEVTTARNLIDKGYKHRVQIDGSEAFKKKTGRISLLIKTAGFYDFFRTYIRRIKEIDGLTQLRQSEAEIWANQYAVENAVDAASLFVQKANQMKEYIEGELYYGGEAEKRSFQKRKEFLETLKKKSSDRKTVRECDRLLELWKESSLIY